MNIQVMAEGATLKSYGRINTPHLQMFYELVLTNEQYLIRYYNESARLRFIRPIKFPTQSVQMHSAGNYLLCYLHGNNAQYDSEIFLLELTDCKMNVRSCNVHLQCKEAANSAICTIYHSYKLQITIFSDQNSHVYSLRFKDDQLQCSQLYKNDIKIKRIQLDKEENIILVTEDAKIKMLCVNWENDTVQNELLISHQADYYCENGFEVRFMDEKVAELDQELERQYFKEQRLQRQYSLKISINEAQYTYTFLKDADLIFFSMKDVLLIMNKTTNTMVRILNGIFNIYEGEESFPSNIQQDNFLVTYKVDKNQNFKINLQVYDQIKRIFKSYTYTSLQKYKNMPYLSFLKKNIEKIMHLNGLIDPLHEQTAIKALRELQELADNFDRSKSAQLQISKNPVELACKMVKNGLESFPEELNKIIIKLKNHILNIKSTYCVIETKRYFEYCQEIQNQIVAQLPQIYKRMQQVGQRSQIKSSVQRRQQNFLTKSRRLITNMISFLTLMINELKIEVQIIKHRGQQQQHIDAIDKNLAYYREVLDSAKSIFLVIRMLLADEVLMKFHQQFKKCAQKKERSLKIWEKHYPQLYRMQYPPLFLHQHFKTINDLTQQKKPSFCQFFNYLLQNRSKFIEVAYFYQYVIKIPAVPYLDSDASDLIQNIWIHIQTLPELEQARNESSQVDVMRYSNLLYKMAGTALKLKQYSFIKYVIQLAITYKIYPLALSLVFSGAFTLQNLDLSSQREQIFMVKSLLLAGKINQAYLYVLRNHSNELFAEFIKWSKTNQSVVDLLQFKLDRKYLEEDDKEVLRLLDLPMQKQDLIQKLIKDLDSQ